MSFSFIASKHPRDKDLPDRAFKLAMLDKLRLGVFYDSLKYRFTEEWLDSGEYVKLDERQPNVHYGTNLIRSTIDDVASMMFGDEHFPELETANEDARLVLKAFVQESELVRIMTRATKKGSIGSVAIHMHVDRERGVHLKDYSTMFLTPTWDRDIANRLIKVTEKYKMKGAELRNADPPYKIDDDDLGADFWVMRVWDEQEEIWFYPWKLDAEAKATAEGRVFVPRRDDSRSITHRLGFCPWVWIKNPDDGDDVDGACWWKPAAETCIFLDYLVSQGGRGLKYMSDPLLVIKEPVSPLAMGTASPARMTVKSPNTILTLTSTKEGGDADAKYLEIDGSAAAAIVGFAQELRASSLEAIHGNRQPEKAGTIGHGGAKALEILNASMVANIKLLRTTYGETGLKAIIKMFLRIVALRGNIIVNGQKVEIAVGQITDLTLRWPAIYASTPADVTAMITGYAQAIDAGIMSRETAIKQLASEFDVEDVAAEQALIEAERAIEDARAIATGLALKATEQITP